MQRFLLSLILLCISLSAQAQKDTLFLADHTVIIGEVKGLEKGVISIETAYSDEDFKIEWDKVERLHTTNEFFISVQPGKQYVGHLSSANSQRIYIINNKDTLTRIKQDKIVFLKEVERQFLDRLHAAISLGLNLAKAQDLVEFSMRSRVTYRAKRWSLAAKYNAIRSSRENTEPVKRIEASLGYDYFIGRNWFTVTSIALLSNTAQDLNLRTLATLGIGKYLVQTNSWYWGFKAGISYNNETYNTPNAPITNNSGEAFLGTELNLYNFGDFNLLTHAVIYPSLTQHGRVRLDYGIDLQYDLPLNFFIKLGFTFNYDNQPVKQANSSDYIFQTTLGWDFN